MFVVEEWHLWLVAIVVLFWTAATTIMVASDKRVSTHLTLPQRLGFALIVGPVGGLIWLALWSMGMLAVSRLTGWF